MAVVQLNKSSAGSIQNHIKHMEKEIEASTQKVNSAINGLSFEVAARENIRSRLYSIKKELNKQETLAVKYREGFIKVSNNIIDTDEKFGNQSKSIVDMISDFVTIPSGSIRDFIIKNRVWKYGALASLFLNGKGSLVTTNIDNKEPSWLAKFINNKINADGSVIDGEINGDGDLWGVGVAGGLIGSILHGEAGIKSSGSLNFKDKDGKWNFKEAGFSTEASASGSVFTGEAKGNIGYLHGEASGDVITGGVTGEAKAALFQDGKFNPTLYGAAKAEVSGLHGEAEVGLGTDQYGVNVGASGDLGHAEAEASFGVGYIGPDENGNAQYGVSAEAGAMASAAEGEVEFGGTIFGIDIDFGVKGYAGAVGAEAGATIATNGIKGSIGGAAIFGGEFSVNIDWSDAEWIGDTVDYVGGVVDDAKQAAGEFFDDVGDFFSSGFDWF